MEVTNFDALEEEIGKFRLKQQVWGCLEKWDSLSDGWTQVSRTQHAVSKGLPLNNVVPILKVKVEVIKQRVGGWLGFVVKGLYCV